MDGRELLCMFGSGGTSPVTSTGREAGPARSAARLRTRPDRLGGSGGSGGAVRRSGRTGVERTRAATAVVCPARGGFLVLGSAGRDQRGMLHGAPAMVDQSHSSEGDGHAYHR